MEHSRNATRTVKSLVVVTAFTKVIDPCLTALGSRFTTIKKLAGVATMATAVTAVGLGFGSGTAQASPTHLNPHPHTMTPFNHRVGHINQRVDNVFDRVQGVFGVGEGTRFDNRIDTIFHVM